MDTLCPFVVVAYQSFLCSCVSFPVTSLQVWCKFQLTHFSLGGSIRQLVVCAQTNAEVDSNISWYLSVHGESFKRKEEKKFEGLLGFPKNHHICFISRWLNNCCRDLKMCPVSLPSVWSNARDQRTGQNVILNLSLLPRGPILWRVKSINNM